MITKLFRHRVHNRFHLNKMETKATHQARSSATWNQFRRFSIIGGFGFIIDSGILYSCISLLNMNIYSGRVVSYLFAASTTWFLNRLYTFSTQGRTDWGRQWRLFLTLNAIGGFANYGVYAILVSNLALFSTIPVMAVALGSFAGLAFNFFLSKTLVFRK